MPEYYGSAALWVFFQLASLWWVELVFYWPDASTSVSHCGQARRQVEEHGQASHHVTVQCLCPCLNGQPYNIILHYIQHFCNKQRDIQVITKCILLIRLKSSVLPPVTITMCVTCVKTVPWIETAHQHPLHFFTFMSVYVIADQILLCIHS